MPRFIYLHGFASSPASKKARLFKERFKAWGHELVTPALDGGNFRELTITSQLEIIEREAGDGPAVLLGSSLGGYLAALYAARHASVERVMLMAPAFGFFGRWTADLGEETVKLWRETGSRRMMHYGIGQETELGWGLLEDAAQYEKEPAVTQPALIYHGIHDAVVPVEASREFADGRRNVALHEVDSDHELLNVVEEMLEGTRRFLSL